MKKLLSSLLILTTSLTAWAEIVLQDDFSGDQGNWATRAVAGEDPTLVSFSGSELEITLAATNPQPGAAYLNFNTVTLEDGDTIRVTVDTATDNTNPRPRDLRVALGFSPIAITGDESTLAVPLSGYYCAIPSAGDPNNPRIVWVDSSAGDLNFFNSSTTTITNPPMDDSVYAGTTLKTWVFEITRAGNELFFAGSLDGTIFSGTLNATGADVLPGFQFNTIGLAYAFSAGQKGIFDNLTVEHISTIGNLPLVEDFSAGQGDWASRGSGTGTIDFTEVLTLSPNGNGQPSSAYRTFTPVALRDGDILRLTVDVSTSSTAERNRDFRIGLGYADPVIVGDSGTLAVSLSGYHLSAPANGSAINPRLTWVDASLGPLNFFNVSTLQLADLELDDSVFVAATPKTWILEVTRSGNDLLFTGSLDGTALGTSGVAISTEGTVVPDYRFNTVGLAYAFDVTETASYDNVSVEFITVAGVNLEPVFGTLTDLGGNRYATESFGYINVLGGVWIYHESIGWLAVDASSLGNWIFSTGIGWIYSEGPSLPWIWAVDYGWLYHFPASEETGVFYQVDTGDYIQF